MPIIRAVRPVASAALAWFAGMVAAVSASAQQPHRPDPNGAFVVIGTVVDPEGGVVPDAEIALLDRNVAARLVKSDARGHFRLDSLARDTATLRVRRLGFQSRTLGVRIVGDQAASLFVRLEPTSEKLGAVMVEDSLDRRGSDQLAEFYARARSNRFGYFLDEDRLDELHPEHTSDALRGVPGVVVRPAQRIGNTVRIRGCTPLIWVDGQRAIDAELDDVTHGTDVAAIEVYSSSAGVPAQYTDRTATCGTILVWLKVR